MNRFIVTTGILAASVALAQPAAATKFQMFYEGTATVYDYSGYFTGVADPYGYSPFNSNYATMTFVFDTETIGSKLTTTHVLGGYSQSTLENGFASPGYGFFNVSGFGSGRGGTFSSSNVLFDNNENPVGIYCWDCDYIASTASSSISTPTSQRSAYLNAYVYSYDEPFLTSVTQGVPLVRDIGLDGESYGYGNFWYENDKDTSVGGSTSAEGYDYFYGNFAPSRLTITVLSDAITAVPEPASWAMMTLGLGFAGLALRRRRAMPANGWVPVRT